MKKKGVKSPEPGRPVHFVTSLKGSRDSLFWGTIVYSPPVVWKEITMSYFDNIRTIHVPLKRTVIHPWRPSLRSISQAMMKSQKRSLSFSSPGTKGIGSPFCFCQTLCGF